MAGSSRVEPLLETGMPDVTSFSDAPAASSVGSRTLDERVLVDALARIEDKTARIEEKYARLDAALQRVESKFDTLAARLDFVADELGGQVGGLSFRLARLPRFFSLIVVAVLTALLAAGFGIAVLKYGSGYGILPR